MSEQHDDRTNPASPLRRDEARRNGDVAKSAELAGSFQTIVGFVLAFFLLGGVATAVAHLASSTWGNAGLAIANQPSAATQQMSSTATGVLWTMLPFLIFVFLAAVVSHIIQTGWIMSPKRVAPDMGRLGWQRWQRETFSWSRLGTVLLGVPKALLTFGIAIWLCWTQRVKFFELATADLNLMSQQLLGLVLLICLQTALILLLFSLVDFGLQRLWYEQRLQMSDRELRDENRMQNGDPQIAARRSQVGREWIG